jgi:hypothetical protein
MGDEETAGKKSQDPLLSALWEVLEATRVVQGVLRESELRTMANIARLEAGERLTEVVRESPISLARIQINEAIDRLTAARQVSRAATFRQLSEEGMTRKEISSKWGFSQQVVSKVVHYPDRSSGTGQ